MASLKNIISSNSGMRFMFDKLALCSAAGRRVLLQQEMMTDPREIEAALVQLDKAVAIVRNSAINDMVGRFRQVLSQLHDIRATIQSLADAVVLDDIGLFEIKYFCLLSEEARHLLDKAGFEGSGLADLRPVISILDPDGQSLPQFYIYPAYSTELASLRNRQQALRETDPEQAEAMRVKCLMLEDRIRQHLSVRLFDFTIALQSTHDNLALLDILFAKALQSETLGLCRPEMVQQQTTYHALFNPWIQQKLEQQQKFFQAVDVSLEPMPGLITGANMAGKTVLLKTVALAQYLFQFGFYVPAASAAIVPVDDILFSMGEDQPELNGLSSFASEMLNVNTILQSARAGKNILALIDEPARTTNPTEGWAIVNALTGILSDLGVRCLITTHYGNISAPCRKLRVKGLVTSELSVKMTLENINDYMDYSLLELDYDDVPMEALRIAGILEIDQELIKKAGDYLVKNDN